MSPDNASFERELLLQFVNQSVEQLLENDAAIIDLEKNAENPELLELLFRNYHSLKGNSAVFGFLHFQNLAHTAENLLEVIRKNTSKINSRFFSLLLSINDFLQKGIEYIHENNNEGDVNYDAITEDVHRYLSDIAESSDTGGSSLLDRLRVLASGWQKHPCNSKQMQEEVLSLIDEFQQSEDSSSSLHFSLCGVDVSSPMQAIRELIEEAEAGEEGVMTMGVLADAFHEISELVKEASPENAELADTISGEMISCGFESLNDMNLPIIQEFIQPLLSQVVASEDAPADKAEPPDTDMPAETPSSSAPVKEEEEEETYTIKQHTIRISEEKVDHFMNYVGELIIASETFNYLEKQFEVQRDFVRLQKEFKNANMGFRELSHALQESLMEVRKVPLSALFQQFHRIVRDITLAQGKKASLVIKGESVQVDKSVFEKLKNPMLHIVRNSLDHGIETVEERIAAGKPEEALLELTASIHNEQVIIQVHDDGRGINTEKVVKRALAMHLITPEELERMDEAAKLRLIFASGLSSRDSVSKYSGRGVGMDVVMNDITSIGGDVNVESTPGQGTTCSLHVPITQALTVIDCMQVRVGEESFLIPLEYVQESFRPLRENIVRAIGAEEEMVKVREKVYPLARLSKLYAIAEEFTHPWDAILINVGRKYVECSIMVDMIEGTQRVVVRPLAEGLGKVRHLAGSAILGDGKVGLIVDVEELCQRLK